MKVAPLGQNFAPERQRNIQNGKKITIFSEIFSISDSFDKKHKKLSEK